MIVFILLYLYSVLNVCNSIENELSSIMIFREVEVVHYSQSLQLAPLHTPKIHPHFAYPHIPLRSHQPALLQVLPQYHFPLILPHPLQFRMLVVLLFVPMWVLRVVILYL